MKTMNQSAHKSIFPRIAETVLGQLGLTQAKDKMNTDFRANGVLTLGAELELQIVDTETCALASRAEDLLNPFTG